MIIHHFSIIKYKVPSSNILMKLIANLILRKRCVARLYLVFLYPSECDKPLLFFFLPLLRSIEFAIDFIYLELDEGCLFPLPTRTRRKNQNVLSSVRPIFSSSNKFHGLKRQFTFYRPGCKRRIFLLWIL